MIVDTTILRQELKIYQVRKQELIQDKDGLHELLVEIEEILHTIRMTELIAERFKKFEELNSMIPSQKKIAECYQPLFDLLHKEFGKALLQSEMDEIIRVVEEVKDNLTEAYRIICDVEGCDQISVSQGSWWREAGYWCVCVDHSHAGRCREPMPKMKPEAIEREKN